MKFSTNLALLGSILAVSALPLKRQTASAADVARLAPSLGFHSGVNPDGHGNCDGAVNGSNGKPILVPCACPPDQGTFIAALQADVAAGHAIHNPGVSVSFPTDNSIQSQGARIEAAIIALQNLNGSGQGCPVVSTTLSLQQQALQNGTPPPPAAAAAAPAPPPPPASNNAQASPADVARLAPPLGFHSGVNPDGHGNCDGAVNGSDGKPILVPCACPPDQGTFIAALQADVAAGHAIHNPGVSISFPTDNSTQSQAARVEAAIVALQNLNGSGQGCPVVSTTLGLQQQALQNGTPLPAAAPPPPPAQAAAPPPPAPAPAASGTASAADVARLAPSLGFHSGVNPDGHGNCDGAVNGADGKPILVPCACPPDQGTFIAALQADVAAGHAIHNPSVSISFPTDNSQQSQAARVEAAIVALQNLNGPGQGCPVVSTTLGEQQQALRR